MTTHKCLRCSNQVALTEELCGVCWTECCQTPNPVSATAAPNRERIMAMGPDSLEYQLLARADWWLDAFTRLSRKRFAEPVPIPKEKDASRDYIT